MVKIQLESCNIFGCEDPVKMFSTLGRETGAYTSFNACHHRGYGQVPFGMNDNLPRELWNLCSCPFNINFVDIPHGPQIGEYPLSTVEYHRRSNQCGDPSNVILIGNDSFNTPINEFPGRPNNCNGDDQIDHFRNPEIFQNPTERTIFLPKSLPFRGFFSGRDFLRPTHVSLAHNVAGYKGHTALPVSSHPHYMPNKRPRSLMDSWLLVDYAAGTSQLIAQERGGELAVIHPELFAGLLRETP